MTIVQAPAETAPQLEGKARTYAAVFVLLGPVLMLLASWSAAANNAVKAHAHPDLAGWLNLAQMLSVIFMIGCGLVILVTTRRFAPVAAWTGFVALVAQLTALAMLTGIQVLLLVLSTQGMDPAALDKAGDDGLLGYPVSVVMFIFFIPGLLVGFIATSIALWRSAWVPKVVPVLFLGVLVTDIALPSEPAVVHTIPFVLLVAACAVLARLILRDGAPAPVGGRHTDES